MKKINKRIKTKSNRFRNISLIALFILLSLIITVLPSFQTKLLSYGANIPFSPVPAKSSLQLEWFSLPTPTTIPPTQPIKPVPPSNQPINQPTNQPVKQPTNQPINQPVNPTAPSS